MLFGLQGMNLWVVLYMVMTALFCAGLVFLGAAVSRLSPIRRWLWRLAVPVAAMAWMRVFIWLTGWMQPVASFSSSLAMAGAGFLLDAVVIGCACWLLARDDEDARGDGADRARLPA